MPKCNNDITKSYRGTEPSPKGLGWCAHAEKIGGKRKGLDGNMWVAKIISNGSKRWFIIKKKTYYVHDNGGRSFKVIIHGKNVSVYKLPSWKYEEDECPEDYTDFIKTFPEVTKIFIGKSPKNKMTTFSAGYGKEFDGNSILLHIKDNKYVFIGESIFSFQSFAEIQTYVSHVGNNDVPYPYAVDKDKYSYLMIEDVVIKNVPKCKNPYDYYYEKAQITNINKKIDNFNDIEKFYIGNEMYNLSYKPKPLKDYNRIAKWEDFGDGLKIIYKNGKEKKLNQKEYVKLLKEFGKQHDFSPIKGVKIIHKRIW